MADAAGPRLELRQSQTLVMTAQLQQSIKLLQLSSLEIADFVASEMEQNPLLTRDEGQAGSNDDFSDEFPSEQEFTERAAKGGDEDDVVQFGQNHSDSWDEGANAMLDAPREAFWDDAEGGTFTPTASAHSHGRHSEGMEGVEGQHSEEISLHAHLQEQLQMDIADPVERIIGLHLIDLVDERGYIPEDISGVAETLGCAVEDVEAVLTKLQRFDPIGVFARNLAECLAIQLREKDRFDPAMEKLVKHLDLMAAGDAKQLAKVCGVELEDIPLMFAEIRELNPKPGYRFGSDVMQAVIPDVFLRRGTGGKGWQVELNSEALPRVLLNRQYYARISENMRRKEDKKYLSEQLAHANWLTKALDQRAQTILKVATEIVRQQDAFFKHGVRYFKPLTLKDISHKVDVHESTVSRVTTHKYISTGSAVYELKYFFSSSVGSTDGDGATHSSESVKHLIREMINAEDPADILSDDTLAERLQEQGIDVARRTVAKYREAMDIPSSPGRRREKKHLAQK